jgi:ubiquinone/menaquinone biosynthesis C-methylase UbiE
MAGANVEVVNADATDLPFPDGRFSAALSFTMLHHIRLAADRLFAEVARVLRPAAFSPASTATTRRVARCTSTMLRTKAPMSCRAAGVLASGRWSTLIP